MKTSLFFFFLLITLPLAQAQRPAAGWSAGQVALAGDTWQTGLVRYNADLSLLELAADGVVQTLSPRKVTAFSFYDGAEGRYRHFVSRPFRERKGRVLPTYFELVVDGRVQLLARERMQRSALLRRFIGRGTNEYFLAYPEGDIIPYHGRLDQLYYLLDDHRPEVEFFVNRVHWYQHDEKPIAELVRFYNSLGE